MLHSDSAGAMGLRQWVGSSEMGEAVQCVIYLRAIGATAGHLGGGGKHDCATTGHTVAQRTLYKL